MRTNNTKIENRIQNIKGHTAGSSIASEALAYRASWVDRLIYWIKRLPIPSWLFYLGVFSIITIYINIGFWVNGYNQISLHDSMFLFRIMGIYPISLLAAIHYIDNTARRSFDDFQPALGKSETENAQLRYELTTMPSPPCWIATLIGTAFTLLVVFLADYKTLIKISPFAFGGYLIASIFGFSLMWVMVYHTVRQLRMVSRIHGSATKINLLHFGPLYAFSRLCAVTGLFFILVLYFDLVFNPYTLTNPGLLFLNVLILPLTAIACFILPIEGMHRRLVVEKHLLQREVNQRLETSMNHLYLQVDSGDMREADAMNKTINSLIATRDLISKIQTWPWKPETSAVFFSALTLPIIVFLIQTLLKNLFHF